MILQRIFEFLIEQVSTSQPSYLLHKFISWIRPVSAVIKDIYTWLFYDRMNRNIEKLFYMIGLFALIRYGYNGAKHLTWVFQHFLGYLQFNPTKFKNTYGSNSYVAITGFTQGIGLAFACEFAKMQFNLVLIGRNKVKIANALKSIKHINSSIDVRVIEVDFESQDYVIKNKIEDQTKQLDISILVNNVGFATSGSHCAQTPQKILKVVKTNINSMVILNKHFVPRFKMRRNRSGIINLSSCMAVFPAPFVGIYPATKAYVDVMSRVITKQLKDFNVDVLTYRPFGVSTPMMEQKRGPLMITPKQCAETAIHQLGVLSCSFGGYKHKLSGDIFKSMTQQQIFRTYEKYQM